MIMGSKNRGDPLKNSLITGIKSSPAIRIENPISAEYIGIINFFICYSILYIISEYLASEVIIYVKYFTYQMLLNLILVLSILKIEYN